MESQYWPGVLGCLVVLAAYCAILPLRRHLLIAALVMGLPTIFMMLIANDTGRWLKFGVFNGWLVASFLVLRGQAAAQLSRRALALGLFLLSCMLAMGPTRHKNINGVYSALLLRLGYQDHVALDVWMNSCDPGWRARLYGRIARRPAERAE